MNFTNRDVTKNIIEFIKNNDLKFTAGRRNTDLVLLCGFVDYLCEHVSHVDLFYDLANEIETNKELKLIFSDWISSYGELAAYDEIDRVWRFAAEASYGVWWTKDINRAEFIIHSPYLLAEKEKV